MCRELYKKQKGCNWGECEKCGVILLLNKLYNGEVIEDKEKVEEFKNNILKKIEK